MCLITLIFKTSSYSNLVFGLNQTCYNKKLKEYFCTQSRRPPGSIVKRSLRGPLLEHFLIGDFLKPVFMSVLMRAKTKSGKIGYVNL
jgi:hypothetical protein